MNATRLLVVAALVAACGKSSKTDGQSLRDGMQVICDAESAPGIAEANPAERWQRIAQYIEANVKNREALDLYTKMGSMPPADARRALEDAAKRAGLKECAMVTAMSPP